MSSIMSRGVGVVLFHSPNSTPPSACRQLQGDGAGGWVGAAAAGCHTQPPRLQYQTWACSSQNLKLTIRIQEKIENL